MTSVPGGPDGQFMTDRCKSVLENWAEAVETIPPVLDKDGTGRVVGYYIK